MARLPHSLHSTFGLLFLLAPWVSDTTSRELRKTGESPASDHLSPFTLGLIRNAPSDHTALDSKQKPPDLPRPTEIQRSKRHCNTTRRSRPTPKPIDNSGGADHESSGDQQRPSPTSEQNISKQKEEPIIQDKPSNRHVDSTNIHKRSPNQQHSTSAPKRKTTCKSTTRKTKVTKNTATTVRPVEKTPISLNISTITSYKTIIPFHSSVNSEINIKNTSSSEKNTQATMTSYKTTKSPEESDGVKDYRTTTVSANTHTETMKDIKETSASEKTTESQMIPKEHGGKTTLAHELTGAHTTTSEHEGKTVSAQEIMAAHTATPEHGGKTTLAHEITEVHTVFPEHGKTMLAQEITGAHTTPPEHGIKTTSAQELTGTQVTPKEHEQNTTLAQEKTAKALTMPPDREEKTTSAHEKTTQVSLKSTEHLERTASTTEKTTKVFKSPIVNPKKTTLTTGTTKILRKSTKTTEKTATAAVTETARHTVKVPGDKSITSSHFNKTEVTHQGSAGSLTLTTSGMDQSSITPEAPANKSYPQQGTNASQAGPHTGEKGGSDPFPAWAIVIVILVAVILLLLFIGLIFLVSFMTRARRALTRNAEDDDAQDHDGPNSYPVYLMEQQNLGLGRIPSLQ